MFTRAASAWTVSSGGWSRWSNCSARTTWRLVPFRTRWWRCIARRAWSHRLVLPSLIETSCSRRYYCSVKLCSSGYSSDVCRVQILQDYRFTDDNNDYFSCARFVFSASFNRHRLSRARFQSFKRARSVALPWQLGRNCPKTYRIEIKPSFSVV